MPRVPDASSVTRLRALQSSSVTDPTKRSASYVPNQPALLYSLRASDVGKGVFPRQSILSTPVTRRFVNPRHQGFITGGSPVVSLPRISLNIEGADFDGGNARYEFDTSLPPAADFEAVIFVGGDTPQNTDQISYISIYDLSGEETTLFGSTTISTSPVWPDATFTSDPAEPNLATAVDAGTFPGLATVITFRNVPLIQNIAIQFGGNAWA